MNTEEKGGIKVSRAITKADAIGIAEEAASLTEDWYETESCGEAYIFTYDQCEVVTAYVRKVKKTGHKRNRAYCWAVDIVDDRYAEGDSKNNRTNSVDVNELADLLYKLGQECFDREKLPRTKPAKEYDNCVLSA